jgi:endoglucanase
MTALAALARLPLFLALLMVTCACASEADWDTFKQQFTEGGRVVDTGQSGISHSEGQGYAMLFAVHYGDRATFDQLWQWTARNLQVRDDALLAWRWDKAKGVTDRNNASDGDLLVAWALVRAGVKWQSQELTAAGRRIAQDVRRKLVKKVAHGLVLVPGLEGFDKKEGMTVNLSYWVFPAFPEIARADPAPEWDELAATGIAMLQYSRFGRWGLPPDWLKLGERVTPGGNPPERFGYDAVRIPVHLLWARRETEALMRPYKAFWGQFEGAKALPSFTNLGDDSVDTHGAGQGIRSVAQAVADHPRARPDRLPALARGESYYSSVLLLLVKQALRERGAG